MTLCNFRLKGLKKRLVKLFVLALVVILACDNPFGQDEITGENRTVSGVVTVTDAENAKGVYVWMDLVNVGAFTDAGGSFTLTLPPKSALIKSGIVTGDFDLYFYTISHELIIKKVILRDGNILYGNGDVDKNGKMHNVVLLKKFKVKTIPVFPLPTQSGYQFALSVASHFTSTNPGSKISIPNGNMSLLGGCFVIDTETNKAHLYELPGTGKPFIASLDRQEQVWGFHPKTGDEIKVRTTYKTIPFVFPYYPDLPPELLSSISVSEMEINENYLSILFSGDFGEFERPEEN